MRLLSFAIGLGLLASAAQAQLQPDTFRAETVGSMHKLCSADESTPDGKYAIGFCYGWLEGLGQFYEQLLIDERFDLEPAVCAGKELTREEVRATFVKWIEANPESKERPALDGIFSAMKETYPCK